MSPHDPLHSVYPRGFYPTGPERRCSHPQASQSPLPHSPGLTGHHTVPQTHSMANTSLCSGSPLPVMLSPPQTSAWPLHQPVFLKTLFQHHLVQPHFPQPKGRGSFRPALLFSSPPTLFLCIFLLAGCLPHTGSSGLFTVPAPNDPSPSRQVLKMYS